MVAFPAESAVTTPLELTDATFLLDDDYDTFPEALFSFSVNVSHTYNVFLVLLSLAAAAALADVSGVMYTSEHNTNTKHKNTPNTLLFILIPLSLFPYDHIY